MLEIKNMTTTLGGNTILHNLNCNFESGVHGLLGPNGAGKTTFMRSLIGLYPSATGSILLNGANIHSVDIGYLPQKFGLFPGMTVRECMRYIAFSKGISLDEDIESVIESVNLSSYIDKKAHTLSGGMVRRVGIAQAFLGNPPIIICDEPTAGLDPKERIGIRNYIAELSRDKIILFATHVVSDIECIADKVLLLKDGEIIATGTPSQLIENMQGKVGEVVCTLSDVADLQGKYHIGNIRQRKNGMVLRLVGDELPEEAVRVDNDIDLEDVYLYYFE